MAPAELNPTADLARFVTAAEPQRPMHRDWRSVVFAFALSGVLHGIVMLNAAVWAFSVPEMTDADLRFAKGEVSEAVEVTFSLVLPPKPVPPTPDVTPPKPPPSPKASHRAAPQPVQPFEKVPEPSPGAVDGGVEGLSPTAEGTLDGESGEPAEAAEPELTSTPQRIERGIDSPPAAALKPPPMPTERPVKPALTEGGMATPSPTFDPLISDVTLAALPPTVQSPPVDFTPPQPQLPPPAPPTPRPVSPTPVPPAASRAAVAGVSSGAEVHLVKPRYPTLSIRAGEEGTVILEIEVFADGSIGFIRIVESPGFERLERAAVAAVRRSKFTPAQREGTPVRAVVRKTIRFRLVDA